MLKTCGITGIRFMNMALALTLMWVTPAFTQIPAKTIPAFSFKKQDNTVFTHRNLKEGRSVFFVFFDTHCDHCQRAMEYINQQYERFKHTDIYLVTLDSMDKVKPFMDRYGKMLNTKKNVLILKDTRNEFIRTFGPRKYPSLFLYSKKRELIMYSDDEKELSSVIAYIHASEK